MADNMKRTVRRYLKRAFNSVGTKWEMFFGRTRMRLVGGFRTANGLVAYHPPEDGNAIILERLRSGAPLMVTRYGLFELRGVAKGAFGAPWSVKSVLHPLCNNAGFFPENGELLGEFAKCYLVASKYIDLYGAWLFRHGLWKYEERVFRECCPQALLTDIRTLDAFLFDPPWTAALEGRRVLVVHPFVKSIISQYGNRDKLFANPKVLPQFASLEVIPAVQSACGNKVPFNTWFEALEYMKKEIVQREFDVALIGAGAYGLPLAAFVKSLGKQAIHTGGVTQMLFGIIGKRWENWYPWLINEWWVRPTEEERPDRADRIENACYW